MTVTDGVQVPMTGDLPAEAVDGHQLRLPDETGEPRVDAAIARLGELGGLPVDEHLDVFQDVHRRLHDALADLDVG